MKRPILLFAIAAAILSAAEPRVSWTADFGEAVTGARPVWTGDGAEGVAVTRSSSAIVLLDARGKRCADVRLELG